jgi:hypothetical protein
MAKRKGPEGDNESSVSALGLLVLLILAAWFALGYELQTLIAFEVHHWASDNPALNVTPQTAAGAAPAAATGPRIEHFNYQFNLVGKELPPHDDATPDYAVVQSKTGQVVIFYNPDEEIDILAGLKAGNTALSRGYNTIFADHLFDSNYSLYTAVYSASPAQAHPWMPRADALRLDSLLIDKLSFGVDAPGPTYLFNWGGLRGIRFGDAAHGGPVAFHAFDNHDRQFRFVFTTRADTPTPVVLNEAEIEQIVQSVRTAY